MKAIDILHNALNLLGYTNSDGEERLDTRIKSRSVSIINQVYSDLFYAAAVKENGVCKAFRPIHTLQDSIDLPERLLYEVMPYGVASFVAQSESDGDQQQVMSLLFNEKRKLLCRITTVKDEMP